MLQVRDGVLQVLLWERAREPFAGRWALPGGYLETGETLESSIRRHLAEKVDVQELSHLEQLDTRSEPDRVPGEWQLATAYLGLVPSDADPGLPTDTAWHPVDRLPPTAFDHGAIVLAARDRLRAKLSYTNAGFALAPATFTISQLRDLYAAALGHEVSATNLQRVLGIVARRRGGLGRGLGCELPAQRACTRPVDRAVDDDAVEPRAERAPAVEAVERAHGGQERLLCDVFRSRRVADDQQRGAIRARPVPAEQLLERGGRATLRVADERALLAIGLGAHDGAPAECVASDGMPPR